MGRLSGVMNYIQEACMVVISGVVSLGSFLCSVVAGRISVALRVLERFGERFWGMFCLHLVF